MRALSILSVIFCLFVTTEVFSQTKVSGIPINQTLDIKKESLVLNGAGVREKFWMDLYVACLYVPSKSTNAEAIIKADESMEIRLYITSGLISSKKMTDAVEEGFESSTDGNTAVLRSKIDQFKSFFKAEIEKKDMYDIVYTPAQGTNVFKNGIKLGQIEGLKFKQALFGIWLGEEPADDDLKKALLNG